MLGRKLYTIRRYSGNYVNGNWVRNPVPVVFTIYASVQPLKANELQTLDEGRRTSTILKLISNSPLQVADVTDTVNSDIITINGIPYEAVQCNPWQNGIINHYSIFIDKAKQ
jgi:hypothetical protein